MKLISRDTDYAIRALLSIAGTSGRVPASELATQLNISWSFLRKILQVLNKNGILRSYKGKGGGFHLARPPESIFIVELIEIFQGPIKLNNCIFKKHICPDVRNCPLKQRIEALEKHVVSELQSITIAGLMEGMSSRQRIDGSTHSHTRNE